MTAPMIILIVRTFLELGPQAAQVVKRIFSKPPDEVTDADWSELWAKTHKTYEDYVAPLPVNPVLKQPEP